jgi:V/A-type H+-transporting ATPase subunit D
MALKFNYNKTTIQLFKKQLAIREKALPILKNKETALRQEVKELNDQIDELNEDKEKLNKRLELFKTLWSELPLIVSLDDVQIYQKKIVGVKIPEISEVRFKTADVSWWNLPAWVPSGIAVLQDCIRLEVQLKIIRKQIDLLISARKKTTQKVNLYEKVQIPEYSDAILKIKRFLEDKENISKAAQKIVKKREERKAAA